jgi:hypothetical protein
MTANRLQPYPVAVALSFIFLILYTVCVLLHLFVTGLNWPMMRLWEMILFGFTWISTLSFFLGALEILIAGFYVAFTLIPLYNYFDNKFREKEGQEMRPLHFKPVALAITSFGVLTYLICMVFDLILSQWAMFELWKIILPGFDGMNWPSFFYGLGGVIVYGLYFAGVFVPIYNYFRKGELAEVN